MIYWAMPATGEDGRRSPPTPILRASYIMRIRDDCFGYYGRSSRVRALLLPPSARADGLYTIIFILSRRAFRRRRPARHRRVIVITGGMHHSAHALVDTAALADYRARGA